MKNLILALFAILILSHCKGPEIITVPLHDSSSVEITETTTDNSTWTDPESLLYQFAVECDENYRAVLKQLNEANSGIQTQVEIRDTTIYLEDGTKVNRLLFDISVLIDSMKMKDLTILRLREELSHQDIPVPVEIEVVRNSKYHKFTGWAFPVLVILVLLVLYLRFKTKLLRFK